MNTSANDLDHLMVFINSIYTQITINKAIFVVNPRILQELYEILLEKDYPVVLYKDRIKFNGCNARLMLLSTDEIEMVEDFNTLDLDFINVSLLYDISSGYRNIDKFAIFLQNQHKLNNSLCDFHFQYCYLE